MMRRTLAKWLGYHDELDALRSRCALLEEHRHGARTRSTRNLALASAEKRRADAAVALMKKSAADADRAITLIARARHTININPKGAQAHLDQAVRILRGEA